MHPRYIVYRRATGASAVAGRLYWCILLHNSEMACDLKQTQGTMRQLFASNRFDRDLLHDDFGQVQLLRFPLLREWNVFSFIKKCLSTSDHSCAAVRVSRKPHRAGFANAEPGERTTGADQSPGSASDDFAPSVCGHGLFQAEARLS